MKRLKFEELNISQEVLSAVKDMGFEEASPIQSEAIPLIMQGKDVIGQAQTGTGKTAAFAIPVIEKVNPESKDLQAVILCPTRELVIQVSNEFRKLMKYKDNLSVVPVYGGQPIERQLGSLRKGVQVVIGTPGRTMDHMRRGSIKMDSVKTIVLDEADEMLDMGFRDDMEVILKDTPENRQTVLFSATMAKDIIELTKQYQKDAVIVNVVNQKLSAPKIEQVYFEVQEKNKAEVLCRLLDINNVKLALVFCNTKSQVDSLVEILKTRGYFADALHGDMNQNQRDKVMNGFRNGSVEILVATDVAGRGIDVNNVEAVFNYDLPRDDEDYTHRIGRTARAGKSGIAFTFVTGKQIYNLKRIERSNGMQIKRQSVPTIDEIETTRINSYATKVAKIIDAGHLSKYINHIEQIMGEDYTSMDVAAALFKTIMDRENESFDSTINFDEPAFQQNRDRQKPFGNNPRHKYTMRENFRKENKPFKSSDRKNDFADKDKDRKPFEEFKPQKGRKFEGESKFSKFEKPKFDRKEKGSSFGDEKNNDEFRPKRSRKFEGESKFSKFEKPKFEKKEKDSSFGDEKRQEEFKPQRDRNFKKKDGEFKSFGSFGKKNKDSFKKDDKFFDKKPNQKSSKKRNKPA
jgi:ATP-dependent RNA helicase DeaD